MVAIVSFHSRPNMRIETTPEIWFEDGYWWGFAAYCHAPLDVHPKSWAMQCHLSYGHDGKHECSFKLRDQRGTVKWASS